VGRWAGAETREENPAMLTRRVTGLLVGLALLCGLASTGEACPFCTMQGKTLTTEVSDASMVLYGQLANANEKAETTDLNIETIIKDNPARAKRTKLTLSRFIDLERTGKDDRFLVFCDLFQNKIDPYRGMALKKGSKLPEYMRGALAVKDKPGTQRLRFYFDYLDNSDLEISNDAYKEFGNADYKDFRALAKDFSVDRVVKWLKDPDTPSFRIGLYASMVGHFGKKEHAPVLRKLLDDPERRAGSGIDGLMAAYVMLDPKDGWAYLQGALKSTKEEFMFRYAGLRAVRFLHDFRTDVIAKKDLHKAACILLAQDDICDMAIDDLRKWGCWDVADQVMGIRKTEAAKLPIVRRALLRYALRCKGSADATAYVAERRKADPEGVKEAEELLKLDEESSAPATPAPVTKK
jgi:hypothetical protein